MSASAATPKQLCAKSADAILFAINLSIRHVLSKPNRRDHSWCHGMTARDRARINMREAEGIISCRSYYFGRGRRTIHNVKIAQLLF
jgi:hypothetical protein